MTTAAEPRRLRGDALRAKIRTVRGWGARKILAQNPWPKQVEIERAVIEGKLPRTEISGCVSSTKTYALAMLALVFLMAFKGSKVFSLAPTFRQVDINLWGYIQQIWQEARANGTPIGRDGDIFATPRIDLGCRPDCMDEHAHVTDWGYTGFSTDKGGNLHGIHPKRGQKILLIVDDAQGVEQSIIDEAENMMAGGETRMVIAYNKMLLTGPTYACNHLERDRWNHVGINFGDLQAARKKGHHLPGTLDPETVAYWIKKYGPDSDFVLVKVENKYPKQEKNTLIPLAWIEAAFARNVPDTGPLILGGDLAGEGDDASAMAPMRGRQVFAIEEWHEDDEMVTTGKFVAALKAEEVHEENKAPRSRAFAFMDSAGMGSPIVKRILEQNNLIEGHRHGCQGCVERLKVVGLNGGTDAVGDIMEPTKDGYISIPAKKKFRNLRSQQYWNLRERLNPASKPETLIGLTRDEDLAAQLSCIKWRLGSDGRIEVEPKIGTALKSGGERTWGIKRRLGFSPDKADAVKDAVWGSERANVGEFMVSLAAPSGSARFETVASSEQVADAGVFVHGVDSAGGLDGVD